MIYLRAAWENTGVRVCFGLAIIGAEGVLLQFGHVGLWCQLIIMSVGFGLALTVCTVSYRADAYKEISSRKIGVTQALQRKWYGQWGPCPKAGYRLAVADWKREQRSPK